MKRSLFCLLFFSSLSFAGEWISDSSSGCKVWNANPQPNETVTWSGGCNSNQQAQGQGVLTWREGSTTSERYEGEMNNGKPHGFGVQTHRDSRSCLNSEQSEIGRHCGDRIVGVWRNGKLSKRFAGCTTQTSCNKVNAELEAEKRAWEVEEKNLKAQAIQRAEEEAQQRAQKAEEEARKKAWEAELNHKDPQAMYLKAGTYIRNGDTWKGQELYEAIIRRFPSSTWAVKASDQLSAKNREDSARAAISQANSAAAQRAYQQCKDEVNNCINRRGQYCYRNCETLLH